MNSDLPNTLSVKPSCLHLASILTLALVPPNLINTNNFLLECKDHLQESKRIRYCRSSQKHMSREVTDNYKETYFYVLPAHMYVHHVHIQSQQKP